MAYVRKSRGVPFWRGRQLVRISERDMRQLSHLPVGAPAVLRGLDVDPGQYVWLFCGSDTRPKWICAAAVNQRHRQDVTVMLIARPLTNQPL